MRMFLTALLAAIFFTTPAFSATITADLEASRLTGVAPFYVFFDSTGSTTTDSAADPWRDLLFKFYFDDPDGGAVWAHTGLSKNLANGSTAAHTFQSAGVYDVVVTVADHASGLDTATVQITVTEPDTVFAGALTVCISTSGTFSGCPAAGAIEITATNIAPTLATYGTSKRRILLRRGESFTNDDTLAITHQEGGHLGAYAAGADPIVAVTAKIIEFGSQTGGASNYGYDWRVTDLDITGTGSGAAIGVGGTAEFILIQGVKTRDFGVAIDFSPWFLQIDDSHIMHHDIGIFELDSDDNSNACFYGAARNLSIMGSTCIGGLPSTEPSIRMEFWQGGVFQHNYAEGAAGGKDILKFHSCEYPMPLGDGEKDFPCADVSDYSEYVVISDNEFIGIENFNGVLVSIRPQTNNINERIRYITIERNYFQAGIDHGKDLWISAADTETRDNIFVGTGMRDWQPLYYSLRGTAPDDVTGNRASNNTCYAAETAKNTIRCIEFLGDAITGSVARNNLLYATGFSNNTVVRNAETDEGNLRSLTDPFLNAPTPPSGTDPLEFMLHTPLVSAYNSGSHFGYGAVARSDRNEIGAFSDAAAMPTVATPVIDPDGETFETESSDISITTTTVGDIIWYTTDGSTPDATDTEYTGTFTVSATTVIKAIGILEDYNNSEVATANFTLHVPLPTTGPVTFSPYSGVWWGAESGLITLDSPTTPPPYTIFYWLNDHWGIRIYGGPLTVKHDTFIRAIAFKYGHESVETISGLHDIEGCVNCLTCP